MKYYKNEI